MADNIGWEKILGTALISSFFTACLTEPVKAWVQRWLNRRFLRRSISWEISNNSGALLGQVQMAKHNDEMKDGIGQRFAMGYKRLAYDLALKDTVAFYTLAGHIELYYIEILYRNFEQVIHGRFDSGDQRLANAGYAADSVLSVLKNRHMSKRLMFRVSPNWAKEHLRENLPLTPYIDVEPPGLRERLFRRYDRLQYWIWRTFYARQLRRA